VTPIQILRWRQFSGILLFFAAVLVVFYILAGRQIVDRVGAEVNYRQRYGADWKEHYRADRHVSVEEDHQKVMIAAERSWRCWCYAI